MAKKIDKPQKSKSSAVPKEKKDSYFTQFEKKAKVSKQELKEKVFSRIEGAGPKKRVNKREFTDKREYPDKNIGERKKYTKDSYKDIYEKTSSPRPSYKKRNKWDEEEQKVEQMPLNKYIAHCGICSRREAVELIKKGKVKVNALVETEPSYKVQENDFVVYDGKRISVQNNKVYILLNKPKGFITTLNDPNGRKTVIDLVAGACDERVYPVGRLDRNTTGLILLTNDGDFAQKLAHPKYNIKKVYQVKLDKALDAKDFEKIKKGVTLEDGLAPVDDLAYVDIQDASVIGIQIHLGKNRIVRRIFEHLGYRVEALDRVLYANLTKKNLPRSKWRFLTEKEIRFLKHYNS